MMRIVREKYYFIPLVAVISWGVTYAEWYLLGATGYYVSMIMSVINSIICYGLVVILAMDTKQPHIVFMDGFSGKRILRAVLAAVLVVILCYYFQSLFFNAAYAVRGYVPEKYMDLISNAVYAKQSHDIKEYMMLGLCFGVLIPAYEELFFRYFLQNSFSRVSVLVRVCMVNICFLLSHDDRDLMIFVLPMSIVCTLYAHLTGGILCSVLIHSLVNLVGILEIPVGELFFSAAYPIAYRDTTAALTNSFFCLIIVILVVYALYRILIAEKILSDRIAIDRAYAADESGTTFKSVQPNNPYSAIYYTGACALYLVLTLTL